MMACRWFITRFFLAGILSLILFLHPAAASAFRDLGVPVIEAISWGAYVGPGKTGARDTIYLSFSQYEAPLFLLAVNPNTGEMRQFNGPLSSEMGAWGFTIDRESRIYLGSYYGAHLLRFDPGTEKWDDLGHPAGEKESHVCSLTTAPDGKIWGGTYPSTHLFYYDPETGKSENFGRMDPEQFYCYPTAGEDGLIYCAIQFQKIDVVVFDPKTKTKTSLICPGDRKAGRISLIKGRDSKIYAKLSTQDQWFRIEEGRKFVPVSKSEIPFLQGDLPDGRRFSVMDSKILRIENPATKEIKQVPLRYDAAGAVIFHVASGPDHRVYGSSMLPLRLFVYDPGSKSLTNLGQASQASGEVYSMGFLGGKLYLASYPEARLSVFDPEKPLQFGDQEDSNPRDLGSLGERLYRPRAMIAGPHGRVYVGGYPDYGLLGGAISVYDPKTNEKRTYPQIIQNQSIASMAFIERPDLMAVGSSVRGGSGTRSVEKEAKLILWDLNDEKKVFETIPVGGARTVLSLASTKEGILYGITDNEKVFVFDSEKREIRRIFDLGFKKPLEVSLQLGSDGKLYGLASEAIFTIDPKDDKISFLGKPPSSIDSGMAILDRKIYYGSGAHLWEFPIPAD